jgi:hypothetical protein
MNLGDKIESALQLVGVTPERVERFLGPDCGCEERKERLNAISAWAAHVLKKGTLKAEEYLWYIIGG